MTKKHFIALADTVRAMRPVNFARPSDSYYSQGYDNGRLNQHALVIELLADFCASQNENFNRQRWLNYIDGTRGPSGGKVKS